jgi:hypothetical protein
MPACRPFGSTGAPSAPRPAPVRASTGARPFPSACSPADLLPTDAYIGGAEVERLEAAPVARGNLAGTQFGEHEGRGPHVAGASQERARLEKLALVAHSAVSQDQGLGEPREAGGHFSRRGDLGRAGLAEGGAVALVDGPVDLAAAGVDDGSDEPRAPAVGVGEDFEASDPNSRHTPGMRECAGCREPDPEAREEPRADVGHHGVKVPRSPLGLAEEPIYGRHEGFGVALGGDEREARDRAVVSPKGAADKARRRLDGEEPQSFS